MPGADLTYQQRQLLLGRAVMLAYSVWSIFCIGRAETAPLACSQGAAVLRFGKSLLWWYATTIPCVGWLLLEGTKAVRGPLDVLGFILIAALFVGLGGALFGYSAMATSAGLQFTVLFRAKPRIPWSQIVGACTGKGAARIDLKDGRTLHVQRGVAGVSEFVEIVRARVERR